MEGFALAKYLDLSVKFTLCTGSHTDNRNYCRKGDMKKSLWRKLKADGVDPTTDPSYGVNLVNFVEFGEMKDSHRGQRKDIELAYDMKKDCKSNLEIIAATSLSSWKNCYRALDRISLELKPGFYFPKEVILLHGDGGIGKTRYCYETYWDSGIYAVPIQNNKTLWFDGYAGEETILFDEFSSNIPLESLLQITDCYSIKVPNKGGFIWQTATRLLFTVNSHMKDWNYWRVSDRFPEGREEKKFPLRRRFTSIYTHVYDESGQIVFGPVEPKVYWPLACDNQTYKPITFPMKAGGKPLIATPVQYIDKILPPIFQSTLPFKTDISIIKEKVSCGQAICLCPVQCVVKPIPLKHASAFKSLKKNSKPMVVDTLFTPTIIPILSLEDRPSHTGTHFDGSSKNVKHYL